MFGFARTLALACASLGLAGEGDLDEELAALIEKTNQLETFHLVYDMTRAGEGAREAFTIEFVYSAPDRMRMRWSGDVQEFDLFIEGTEMFRSSSGDERDSSWRRMPLPDPQPSMALLQELFPPSGSIGPGGRIEMGFADNVETGKTDFNLRVGAWTDRTCLLGWLELAGNSSAKSSNDGQTIVCTVENYSFSVARSTGILQQVSGASAAGSMELRLRECYLDQPIDEDLFGLPDEARTAEIDSQWASGFQMLPPDKVRRLALLRVERSLYSGERTWDDEAREDWRAIAELLHREWIPERIDEEEVQQWIDGFAEWVHEQTHSMDPAELAKRVAEQRDRLKGELREALANYREALPAVESDDGTPRQELLDVEGEVIEPIWDELAFEPLLAAFDEAVGAELDD